MSQSAKFSTRVWSIVSLIPAGHVATYGQIAELAGWARGARRVGGAMRRAPSDLHLPWHRVVAAGGRIALPPGSRSRREQEKRLAGEGVRIEDGRLDMNLYGWEPGLDELVWGPVVTGILSGSRGSTPD